MPEPLRPDPDQLLRQPELKRRGKLKIFFGACAGTGKTFAMLEEAQRLYHDGLDVLCGVVETHGRQETAGLLEGLPQLPPARHIHRGKVLTGFDPDAALARHPALILMDELACSNPPGSRHPKRWQDVNELLEAGIDVLTTLNVQHLESLNDVVSAITGIRVRETLPDPVFDTADEIVLVDLTVGDLLQRLRDGKVYIPAQAERAIEHFFREGNLIALRELALRRAADRVDEQKRLLQEAAADGNDLYPQDGILLCLDAGKGSEKLIRTAARLAARLGCRWHTIYTESTGFAKQAEHQRRKMVNALRLASQLGAGTATLSDPQRCQAIIRYAREHRLGKVILGRRQGRWLPFPTLADTLIKHAPELEVILISRGTPFAEAPKPTAPGRDTAQRWQHPLRGCLLALILCLCTSFIATRWLPAFDDANLAMLYLLNVVIVALFYGRGPAVVASLLNVISFDLFFIAPRGSLAVSNIQYLLTFGVMLTVGLLIGHLTAGVRYQARIARYREQRTRQLYEMSRALADGRDVTALVRCSETYIRSTFNAACQILMPDENGQLTALTAPAAMTPVDTAIARWSFEHAVPAGAGTDTLPGVPYRILPLVSSGNVLGLLVIEPLRLRQITLPEQQRLLDTFLMLIAGAMERHALLQSEQQTRIRNEREQLRNTFLAALSHDLRTPLTVLFAQAEILALDLNHEKSAHTEQAIRMRRQIISTIRLVNNLLDMARYQSGGSTLNQEWMTLQELAGSILNAFDSEGNTGRVTLDIKEPMALVFLDAALTERIFINLLENAVKYAGEQASITLRARVTPGQLVFHVLDNGPGIPAGQETLIFEKFARGTKESAIPGIGLGLAICQAIVTLHQGTIQASNQPQGGADVCIVLPQPAPPQLEDLE
ncbi:two-component system sensor histidine kinase KdpD [Tatumella terrea]|uniref:histidine kinase n=1 Tax=Tatumella terrea TaxID=419007 RepID=A0ABW1W074_9GAMM